MTTQTNHTGEAVHVKHSAKQYIIGYILSLVLTAIAFVLALGHAMSFKPLIIILMILAAFQILVQLFFFMHINESDGPPYHAIGLGLALLFAFAFALMSIWIMSFGYHAQLVS